MYIIILTILLLSCLLPIIGSIMLWNRYNYLSDGLVHASLFAGIFGYFINISQILSMILVAALFAILVFIFKFRSDKNSTISIISTLFISAALIIASKFENHKMLNLILFGDIFAIDLSGLLLICFTLIILIIFIKLYFKELVTIAIDKDLAHANGINVNKLELLTLIILSLVIAISIKITGAFLLSGIIIIPAVTARLIATSPLQMLLLGIVINLCAGFGGLYFSLIYDLPLSPAIGIIAIIFFIITNLYKRFIK